MSEWRFARNLTQDERAFTFAISPEIDFFHKFFLPGN